jgi:hypothetical protein
MASQVIIGTVTAVVIASLGTRARPLEQRIEDNDHERDQGGDGDPGE